MNMDLNKLMQQAQQMQEDMQKAQEEMAKETVEGTAGGGAVSVKATGTGKILEIKIKKEAVDPEDVETLEDLVLAAVNSALQAAEELPKSKMNLDSLGDLGSLGLGFRRRSSSSTARAAAAGAGMPSYRRCARRVTKSVRRTSRCTTRKRQSRITRTRSSRRSTTSPTSSSSAIRTAA